MASTPLPNQRIRYLDSLRGLAALVVVIFHVHAWLDFTKATHFKSSVPNHILNILFNGYNAVSLFFVLSGFVLSLRYIKENTQQVSYTEFMIKRIFRLYPVYWFVLISTALYLKSDLLLLTEEASMLFASHHTLVVPVWSLVIEMKISLIFLFLLVLALRNVNVLFVSAFLYWLLFGFEIYILHFCLGILLAMNFEKIQRIRISKAKRYVSFFLGLLLCSFEEIRFMITAHKNFRETDTVLGFFLGAFGCTICLTLAMSAPNFQKKIKTKPLLFLGDISYGLYMGHWLIFIHILEPHFEWFSAKLGSFFLAHLVVHYLLVIPLSILFATFLHYVIEKPFIKLGYKVAKKYNDKLVFKLN